MEHPFQRWIDAARPRTQLWRTMLGALLIVVIWLVWTIVVGLVAVRSGLVTPHAMATVMGQSDTPLSYGDVVIATGVLFATFWGLWFGVWAAVRLLSKRSFASVISFERRVRLGQFAVGMALAAGYLAAGVALSSMSGIAPQRSNLSIETWLMSFAPLAILIFLQSAGEELFFRGFLTQQLAARTRHPLVWGLLPSMAFGIAHASNGGGDLMFGIYYVAAATLLGLVMTATVWRTGGLSAAMGFHFINNIGALLVVSVAGSSPPVSLFLLSLTDAVSSSPTDLLMLGLLLAFVLSPFAPLPKGQSLRRNDTRAAP
ncbi:MAG: CPBP family intramembrane glutamic endopeptidase [Hyphomonadaceae bacterium]